MTATTIKCGRLDKERRQNQCHDALWQWQHVRCDGQQRRWQLMAAGTVGAVGGRCWLWRTMTTLAGNGSGRKQWCNDDDECQQRHGGLGAFECGGGWWQRREEGGGVATVFIYLFISTERAVGQNPQNGIPPHTSHRDLREESYKGKNRDISLVPKNISRGLKDLSRKLSQSQLIWRL